MVVDSCLVLLFGIEGMFVSVWVIVFEINYDYYYYEDYLMVDYVVIDIFLRVE